MSAGVSDQRMKGQGNQVTNGPKEHVNEHEEFDTWRTQHHQGYTATPISTTMASADPYISNYYGTSFPYQAFGVGDGTWSNSDPMTFLGGYGGQMGHDSYGMDGMFGGGFGQGAAPAAGFNYFHGNGDYSTWGNSAPRKPHYDDYYRQGDAIYPNVEALKGIDQGMQGLGLADGGGNKVMESGKEKEMVGGGGVTSGGGGGQPKKMTWASIASQPAKPQPQVGTGGVKKKGPGMPPPPMVPGKHNMDMGHIGTWEGKNSSGGVGKGTVGGGVGSGVGAVMRPGGWGGGGSTGVGAPPRPQPQNPYVHHTIQQRHPVPMVAPPLPQPPNIPLPQALPPQLPMPTSHQQQQVQVAVAQQQQQVQQGSNSASSPSSSSAIIQSHPVLDELRIKNNYNPIDFDTSAKGARFFVIKSYSEDDIHRSIKYEIWCSTEHGNKRLDQAFRERETKPNGAVYLFFSVNGSGHFCGMAKMVSAVDYSASSSVWSQDKWKGQFKVRWIYVKDVPNVQLRHIKLENNENKPVTNSRDTQEVPFEKGKQVLRVMHTYRHSTSIFDDFVHYERRQEEEDSKKEIEASHPAHQNTHHKDREGGRGGRGGGNRGNRNN